MGIVIKNGSSEVTGITQLSADGRLFDIQFVGFGHNYQTVFGDAFDITSRSLAEEIVAATVTVLNEACISNLDLAGNPATALTGDTDLFLPYTLCGTGQNVNMIDLDWKQPNQWWGPFSAAMPKSTENSVYGWIRVCESAEGRD